ncbi:SurA N-terminal domain-containing protein [Tropicimonas sp. S265A]|uniref:SurA N-terminal domain-containing protein n=1 Tax=Tropicimonas sp. S265A TaxID=3415134 RepID=UPI003C7EACC5
MKGKTSNIFMTIILGLLILGLAGFGVTSFGGSMARIGSVGDTDITVDDYARTLQNQIRATTAQTGQAMTMADARAIGLDRQVLSQLVVQAALDNEANRIGLSVGDERVLADIQAIPTFNGIDGTFDRDAYEFSLQSNGLSPPQFEEQIRADAARTLLQGAVAGGIRAPEAQSERLYQFISERRQFTWAPLDLATLGIEVAPVSDAEMRSYYETNPAEFTEPEAREITYVLLTPDMMLDQVAPSDEEVQRLYDLRSDEFNRPARRVLDRLVFATEDEAAAALARINAGEITFEALVEERGLTLDDVDQGEVAVADLSDDLAEAIFAPEDTGVIGPLPSSLGPALFQINAILLPQVTALADVRDDLVAELALDTARRAISAEIEALDDQLAGGATLEELAEASGMEIGQIAMTPETDEGPAAYPEFREVALTAQESDFPELELLDDGGVFALRVDGTRAPRLQPFDEVRDQVAAAAQRRAERQAVRAEADALAERLRGGEVFSDLGVTLLREDGLTRDAFLENAPIGLVTRVFELNRDDVEVVVDEGGIALVQLDAILGPDPNDPDAALVQQVLDRGLSESLARDIFNAYSMALQEEAGIQIDQSAINAVQAQFP